MQVGAHEVWQELQLRVSWVKFLVQIEAGESIGDLLLVKEGLKPGDKVVIDALQKVTSGMLVNPEVTLFDSQADIKD